MSVFTRNLTFHCNNLGRSATLLLTFEDQMIPGIYQDCFPTAWRVVTFSASGPNSVTVTYHSQLAIVKPQVQNGVIVGASTWKNLEVSQSTDLIGSGDICSFTDPVYGPKGEIQAWNKTSSRQNIGLGFDNNHDVQPTTVMYYPDVGVNSNISVEFRPVLRAYITANYRENEILSGAMQTPPIWEANLSFLNTHSAFGLAYDSGSGTFTITQNALDIAEGVGAIAETAASGVDKTINVFGNIVGRTQEANNPE